MNGVSNESSSPILQSPLLPLLCHFLLGVFPNSECSRHVDIQAPNDSKLGNFDTGIDSLKVLDRDSFLFLSQKQDSLVRKFQLSEANTRRGLFQSNNGVAISFLLA